MFRLSYSLWSYYFNYVWLGVQIVKFLILKSSLNCCCFLPLRSKQVSHHPIIGYLSYLEVITSYTINLIRLQYTK
jgi:hypothetical protein